MYSHQSFDNLRNGISLDLGIGGALPTEIGILTYIGVTESCKN